MRNKAEVRIKIDKQHEKSDNCKDLVTHDPLKRYNILNIRANKILYYGNY